MSRRHQRIKARADQLRAAAKNQLRTAVEVGRAYVVEGYWTGTFRARVESVSGGENPLVRLVVLDAMRRRAALSCPECLAELDHDGDHTFDADFHAGTIIELALRNARFLPTVFEDFPIRQQPSEDKTA